ncbi:MAG: PGPGW domain-containing protein [Patulibacter sp.]
MREPSSAEPPAAKPSGAQRPLIASLRDRRARHKQRNLIVRGLYLVAALTVLLAGVAMLVLPGPALVVIPVGLTLLALEFASAERLLDRALDQADAAKEKARNTSRTERLLIVAAGVLAAAAALVVALLYDLPVLPL